MNDLVRKLMNIGLSVSEAKVYYYLLKKKNYTATEISKLAKVPQSKIYEILRKLEQKGLCTETLGKVKKYSPVNPQVGFNYLQDELKKMKEKIADLSELLFPFYLSEKDNIDPLDYIKVLRDKKTISNNFGNLTKQATKEILSFVKGPFAMDLVKMAPNLKEYEEYNSLKRGVVYKTIHEKNDLKNKVVLDGIQFFSNAGEDTRISHKLQLPFKMFIFDEKVAMFTLEDKLTDETSMTSLIIEHPDLIKGLKLIFNLYWQNSITFEEYKMKEKMK